MLHQFKLSEPPNERGHQLIGVALTYYLDSSGLSRELAKAEITRNRNYYGSVSDNDLAILDADRLEGDDILRFDSIAKELAIKVLSNKHKGYSIGHSKYYKEFIPEGTLVSCFGMRLVTN